MKKILSLLLSVILCFSGIAVFAEDTKATVSGDTYSDGSFSGSYKSGTAVTVSIPEEGKNRDYVIRAYNSEKELLYVSTQPVIENGTVSFAFDLPELGKGKRDTVTGEISVSWNHDNTQNRVRYPFEINVALAGSSGSSVGVSNNEEKDKVPAWIKTTAEVKDEQPKIVDPTDVDTLVNTADKIAPTTENAVNLIKDITKETIADGGMAAALSPDAKHNMAIVSEFMASKLSEKTTRAIRSSKKNTIVIDKSVISENDVKTIDSNLKTFEKTINDDNITLNRKLYKDLTISVSTTIDRPISIEFDKDVTDIVKEADRVIIANENFRVSYSGSELAACLDAQESNYSTELDFVENTKSEKTVKVSFESPENVSVKVAFPCDIDEGAYKAILNEKGDTIGGKYNPADKTVEAIIDKGETLTIKDNKKEFQDLKNSDETLRRSIEYLASSGIFQGKSETEFDLNGTITRAEIVTMVMRVLSAIDPNEDGNFEDVQSTDWFFGAAGSARKLKIVEGFLDDENVRTFRGGDVISKEQIYTMISRILTRPENGYIIPTGDEYERCLNYNDRDEIGEWALDSIALANSVKVIVESDNPAKLLSPKAGMTRGAAASAIYRLFVIMR